MQQCWRWFGRNDSVPLAHARQAGATGIVTALHHLPNGVAWSVDEIERRKAEIQVAGMQWSVVESIPITEDIKTRSGEWKRHIDAYRTTLRNLAQCQIKTVCYNFSPVLDWTRTDLRYQLRDGGLALRFDATALAIFDLCILGREGALDEWAPFRVDLARTKFVSMSESERARLTRTIIAGLPGAEESYSLDSFRNACSRYKEIGGDDVRSNLVAFLDDIIPVAAENGVRLGIHPDDPPRPMLGLPRILATAADVRWLFSRVDHSANGLTLCAGTFGVRSDNDVIAIAREFAGRIHFVHLRNVRREEDSESFYESYHLDGEVDMVTLIQGLTQEEQRRRAVERDDNCIPMRADHGHQILDDIAKTVNPGYSAIGRLKGLAELRGVMRTVESFMYGTSTRDVGAPRPSADWR
jgi:mannonate dehydratase